MKKMVLKLALAAALVVAALAIPASSQASFGGGCCPHCFCPENYAPVICSNGRVYSNACFASLDCATGCVPYGNDAF